MTSQSEESAPSALLSFTAENARSYRDEVTLSLLATRLSAEGVPRSLTPAGMAKPVRVLPAAGIFGANASGKTTILRAMADMKNLVLTSFVQGSRGTPIPRERFLLDSASQERPTRFEVDLVLEGVRWVYGFEVNDEQVREEYAYHWPRGRQALVFQRDNDSVDFGSRFKAEDRALENLLRDNSLLLSVAGTTGNDQLASLFDWFKVNLRLFDLSNRQLNSNLTGDMYKNADYTERIIDMLQAADLGISDLSITDSNATIPNEDIKDERFGEAVEHLSELVRLLQDLKDDYDLTNEWDLSLKELRLIHTGADNKVPFHQRDESQGTLVWFSLIGPVLKVLEEGVVILIDELDASLHPQLVEQVIKMFQNPQINRRDAQLIFNSHDGKILEDGGTWALGRDQIWFTRKNYIGESKLSSLYDFSPRRDEAVHHRYFQGRYGAVPVIDKAAIGHAMTPVE